MIGVNEKYLNELKSSLLAGNFFFAEILYSITTLLMIKLDVPSSYLSSISTELVWPSVNCVRESIMVN